MLLLNQSLRPEECHVQVSLGLVSSTRHCSKGDGIALNSKQLFSGAASVTISPDIHENRHTSTELGYSLEKERGKWKWVPYR